METLIQITSPFFCAGAVYQDGKFVEYAPILKKWVQGKSLGQVQSFCQKRNWKIWIKSSEQGKN
ncbi:MAG: hypothetical protein AABZ60_18615 [Planctomycetota bacterium]